MPSKDQAMDSSPDMAVRFSSMYRDDGSGCLFYQLRVEHDHNQFLLLRHSIDDTILSSPRCTLVVLSAEASIRYPVNLEFSSVKPAAERSVNQSVRQSPRSSKSPMNQSINHSLIRPFVSTRYYITQESRVQWKQFMKEHRDKSRTSLVCGYVDIEYDTMNITNHQSISQSINQSGARSVCTLTPPLSEYVHTHQVRLAIGFRTTKPEKARSQTHSANQSINQSHSRTTNQFAEQLLAEPYNPESEKLTKKRKKSNKSNKHHLTKRTLNDSINLSINQSVNQPYDTCRGNESVRPSVNRTLGDRYDHHDLTKNDGKINPRELTISIDQSVVPSVDQTINHLIDQSLLSPRLINQSLIPADPVSQSILHFLLSSNAYQANEPSNRSTSQLTNKVNSALFRNANQLFANQSMSPRVDESVNQSINQSVKRTSGASDNEVSCAKRIKRASTDLVYQFIDYSINQPSQLLFSSPSLLANLRINQSINYSINQSIIQPNDRSISPLSYQSSVQSSPAIESFSANNHLTSPVSKPLYSPYQSINLSANQPVHQSINQSISVTDEIISSLLQLPVFPLLPPQLLLPETPRCNEMSIYISTHSSTRSLEPAVNQSVNQPVDLSINQLINQPLDSYLCSPSWTPFEPAMVDWDDAGWELLEAEWGSRK